MVAYVASNMDSGQTVPTTLYGFIVFTSMARFSFMHLNIYSTPNELIMFQDKNIGKVSIKKTYGLIAHLCENLVKY